MPICVISGIMDRSLISWLIVWVVWGDDGVVVVWELSLKSSVLSEAVVKHDTIIIIEEKTPSGKSPASKGSEVDLEEDNPVEKVELQIVTAGHS